jgi:hypothetical protein
MTARETNAPSARKHRRRAALLLAAILPICLSGAAQACEKYGPVALTGTLSSLRVSGPPGYGKTPKTDAVETIAILQMSRDRAAVRPPQSPVTMRSTSCFTVGTKPFE